MIYSQARILAAAVTLGSIVFCLADNAQPPAPAPVPGRPAPIRNWTLRPAVNNADGISVVLVKEAK